MKVAYSPYQLKAKPPFQDREGALLRFEFDDGIIGYSDCHPWDIMGDLSLDKQLKTLSGGKFTSLTERSFVFARIDGEARNQGKNLFEGLSIPPSHWLVTDEIPDGFDRIKVKHIEFNKILEKLPSGVKVRLDFNEKLTEEKFINFLKTHERDLHHIDFIEDPFPFDQKKWEEIQKQFPVKLACDRHAHEADDQFVTIIKPTAQGMLERSHIVITSYLDHPLGQLAAAYMAAVHRKKVGTCGLLSHHVYHSNPFSEQLDNNGPYLIPPKEGRGFGYDALLENLPWKAL